MNKTQIKKGLDAIAAVDRHMAQALEIHGYPTMSLQPRGFETFLCTIINQQLSSKAAATILARVMALLPVCSAKSLLRLPDQILRDAGLSWRKVEYLKGLAQAIESGDFEPESLEELDDEEAIESITRLRGFGRWSAENYLIFSMGRRDIFPADDLIIQTALQKIKRMRTRPTAKAARKKVQHWAPWRSVGALFLWHVHEK
ncbi:MAG: DNA-3-methyladenine glycosylase 2 family protein [Gammaproteobacteria bacterium]|nr:DNA-3-methyladenine glycosylase 2 family protein [Gammaproteobacteria bacterium]